MGEPVFEESDDLAILICVAGDNGNDQIGNAQTEEKITNWLLLENGY